LPDMGIGQSNTFAVIFTPPTNTSLAFYQDAVTIYGTNMVSPFQVNLYALVTSDQHGAVQFFVDDILGSPVPNATVRLHNDALLANPPAVTTDTNGLVTVTNLQEGTWDWQVVASGCSATIGTVAVVASQTVYQHTRLSRSLVTVTFNVVPVPFTDQYQIQVEQVFQTHVPAGVLVVTPPFMNFSNILPGFQANFTVNVQNYGLIQMTDCTIQGATVNGLQLTPLITYIPVLLPMQSVDVPFTLAYNAPGAPAPGGLVRQDLGGDILGCIAGGFPFGGLADPAVLQGLAAIFGAQERCYTDLSPQDAAAALGILAGLGIVAGSFAEPLEVLANYLGSTLGCIVGQFLSGGGGGGGDGLPSSDAGFGQAAGCFAPETQILMADGSRKPISGIRTNDIVRSGLRPENTAIVSGVFTLQSSHLREVQLASENGGGFRRLLATEEHLVWVDGRGWTPVADLRPGDWLFNFRGERVKVAGCATVNRTLQVYTLSLSGDNAFYANDILVRDLCGLPPPGPVVRTVEERK
jgi:large repetitive protein